MLFLNFLFMVGINGFIVEIPSVVTGNCTFTQNDAFVCFMSKFDLDQNGGVSKGELVESLKESPFAWVRALRWMHVVQKTFADCDYDKNDQITTRDMYLSKSTCFANQRVRCAMEKICT